jgi:UDP-N-acetylglucosamine--N-acetylmuramyl-(pentapeptide) pyrophosphoryl-undecaprenol N-acetylglucosamine transferase
MTRAANGVLVMAGGTGGHIFPGLAVAEQLRSGGTEVRWLGARGAMECEKVPAAGIPLDVVDISALRGKGIGRWIIGPLRLLRAVWQAWRLLGSKRPACAIRFGGYAAGPGGIAAKLRGIPLLVHEQNRVPGLTNRTLARFAKRVLQAFPDSWPPAMEAVTCGNPVRRTVAELAPPEERMAGRTGALRILLTGGSQGALALNRLVPEALGLVRAEHDVVVRHQSGPRWLEETRDAYRRAGFDTDGAVAPGSVEVTEFIDDMASAYAWADVVVCRAGALTVSEVAAAGVAALFIPYPHAVDDHQTRNAGFLVENDAALLMQESQMDARMLANVLSSLAGDRAGLVSMAKRGRAAAVPDSAERVAALCREYLS